MPENRADPQSRLIAVPVTRIRARSAHPGEPIFRLEGGPGITNMAFAKASRFADNHDVVLVGYRGVDGSVRLDCPEVESALKHSTDVLGKKFFRAYGDALPGVRESAEGRRRRSRGLRAASRSTISRPPARRSATSRIDLLSESAGTRTAMIYSWRYPRSIHRSVMIGVNPPGHFLWDARTTDEQIARYAALCSKDAGCRERTDNLAATLRRAAVDVPDRWWGLPIKHANVRVASFYGLMESTPEAAPLSGPMTLDTWLAAAKGDASGLWFQSLLGDLAFPKMMVWGQRAAAARLDAQAARDYFAAGAEARFEPRRRRDAFVWGGGSLIDGWPAAPDENEYSRVRRSNVETLLIGGALDFSTPPQVATKELLPYLPNGHQVVLPGFGHTTSFWNDQPEAGTRLIDTFFDSGRVDDSLYRPQKVDFTPDVTQPALGKGLAGAILGLALLTALSLLWMPGGCTSADASDASPARPAVAVPDRARPGRMVRRRAHRSDDEADVPLDDARLATLSVGVPIGLGLYFAWVNRDWRATTKAAGFAAAMGGAARRRAGWGST